MSIMQEQKMIDESLLWQQPFLYIAKCVCVSAVPLVSRNSVTPAEGMPLSSYEADVSQAKLKYPTHFAKERRVYLDGEAYFVVRKQNGKRFIVHTAILQFVIDNTECHVVFFR